MLGDIHLAEPGALIGFAGPRVIEQTIREKLPEGFQRAEFLEEKGMVDKVVHRHEIHSVLAQLIRILMNDRVKVTETAPSVEPAPVAGPAAANDRAAGTEAPAIDKAAE